MRIVFTYLFLFSICISFGQITDENFKNSNLIGNVKQIKEYSYKALFDSVTITKGDKERENDDEKDRIIIFDEKKNIIEQSFFFSDGNLSERGVNKFNEKGRKTSTDIYDSTNKLKFDLYYQYHDDGKLKRIVVNPYGLNRYGSFEIIYKYDTIGNLIEATYNDNNNKLERRTQYSYNDKKNIINYKVDYPDGFTFQSNCKYDDFGNMIEEETYDSNLILVEVRTYKYDDKRNIIEENLTNKKNNHQKTIKYKYEFDSIGNWIKKVKFYNSMPEYLIEREIEYYN